MLDGEVPYRDFELEYPPAALPVFLLPSLAGEEDYRAAFEGLMLACGFAALAALAYALVDGGIGAAGPRRCRLRRARSPCARLRRPDPLRPLARRAPGGSARRARGGRGRPGAASPGRRRGGEAHPLVVLPLALVYVGRRHGRRAALESLGVFVGVAAVIVVPFAVISPDGLAWRA